MGYSVIHGYSVINPFLQVGCLARKAEKVEREREHGNGQQKQGRSHACGKV